MGISKKILTIILSIGLLFAVSCGDKPTGSGTGGTDGGVDSELIAAYNGNFYKNGNDWFYINGVNIYKKNFASKPNPTDFTENDKIQNLKTSKQENVILYNNEYIFEFVENGVSVIDRTQGESSIPKFYNKV